MTTRERMAPLLLGALAGSLVAGRLGSAAGCLALAGTCATLAGARWPRASALRLVGFGMAVAVVLNTLLVSGHPLGPVPHASVEGLRLGALLSLRLAGAAVAVHGLGAAWPGERAADELARLLAPLERVRVPVREARAVLGLALRFVPLLAGEGARIARIQGLRAGRPPRGWRERITRRRAVVIPVMVNALERAERVSLALEARHHRLRAVALPVARAGGMADWAWGIAGLAVAVTSLVWRG
jgi:energy-coupling factor transporter transmembrane protein EcfT